MIGRERDLRRTDEVEVILLEVVDVIGGLAEEAGALHGARLDQRGRDHRREAPGGGLAHRDLGERQLELRADTGEVVEPCAADLGTALGVDRTQHLAELEVVARLEAFGGEVARGADGVEHDEVFLAALGRIGRGEVGQRLHQLVERLGGLRLRGLGVLDLLAELLRTREQLGLLVALGLRDQLAEVLLLSAYGLEYRDRRPALLVSGNELVDDVSGLAAAALGCSYGVGVFSQDSGVDHGAQPICRVWTTRWR